MKAVVFGSDHALRLDNVEIPQPTSDQVLIDVAACGICGTDMHAKQLANLFSPPVVLGHEFSGTISHVGDEVKDLSPGDRVVVNPTSIPCGKCAACARNLTNQCLAAQTSIGIGLGKNGGMAEYVAVEAVRVHRFPDGIPLEWGAVTEPLSIAIHGVSRSEMTAGDKVAVIGAGPVGLLTLQVLRARGASEALVVEPSAGRRDAALRAGADRAADPSDAGSFRDQFDVVFDCSGAASALPLAIHIARHDGSITIIGTHTLPIVLEDTLAPHVKELKIGFSMGNRDLVDFAESIEMIRTGKINLTSIISRVVPLAEFQRAFDLMADASNVVKVLINCT
jgi:2-desacetyl-2-hydroxyethyl bacteriochlorophyllide A dehydrogenase